MSAGMYNLDKKQNRWIFKKGAKTIEGSFLSPDGLITKHSDGNYEVLGEVVLKEALPAGRGVTVEDIQGNRLKVAPLDKAKKLTVVGYIPCSDRTYVAIVQKNKKKWLIWLIAGVLLLGLLIGGLLWWRSSQQSKGKVWKVDSSASGYKSKYKRPANLDSSSIAIPGYQDFTIKKGSRDIKAVLFNPEGNPCFFKFILKDEAGKVLYESELVPPGSAIKNFKIKKAYDKVGEYKANLFFESHDLETPELQYNGSSMAVTIKVE